MYASKEDWMNTYREKDGKTYDEIVKLYEERRQLPGIDVALRDFRDHAIDTLSLAMKMENKVSKVRENLEKFPTTDIIHLNRETNDILNTRLLKATLQMSKME